MDASAIYLLYTNRPNYHQYTLLQVATGTQIPAAKSKVINSSNYYPYLHTSLLTGTFPLSQDVRTLDKQKLLVGIESTKLDVESMKLERDVSINSDKGEGRGVNCI